MKISTVRSVAGEWRQADRAEAEASTHGHSGKWGKGVRPLTATDIPSFSRFLSMSASRSAPPPPPAPSSKLTQDVRQFIKLHRLELIAEVSANDGTTRRSNWQINLEGKLITMIGAPMTYDEALAAAHWRWPESNILEMP